MKALSDIEEPASVTAPKERPPTAAAFKKARRLGVGAAITLAPLIEARGRGYRVSVLTATAMGVNIYRRLGFREYCPFVTYAWAEDERWCLDGTVDQPLWLSGYSND